VYSIYYCYSTLWTNLKVRKALKYLIHQFVISNQYASSQKKSLIQIQYLCPGSIKSINSSNTSAVIVAMNFTITVRPPTPCFFWEKNTYDSSRACQRAVLCRKRKQKISWYLLSNSTIPYHRSGSLFHSKLKTIFYRRQQYHSVQVQGEGGQDHERRVHPGRTVIRDRGT